MGTTDDGSIATAIAFDALFQIDRSRALEPLDRTSQWERGGAPETYPFGA